MSYNSTISPGGVDPSCMSPGTAYLQWGTDACDLSHVPNYVNAAVPYFILFSLLEALYGYFRGNPLFRPTEVIASFNLGITQQLLSIWYKAIYTVPYIYVYRNYRVTDLNLGFWGDHIVTLLAVEMAYYFFHRYAHEFHLTWAPHSVHHSGEDYNLPTALRQGAIQPLFSWLSNIPLALMGIPPSLFVCHTQWNLIYQFYIHTDQVGQLGFLEYFMNTPSHHRMHHRPPGNCNYGGMLIIYDKMFGTFVPEDVQVDYYGLAKQLNTFDPVAANLSHFSRMSNIHSEQNCEADEGFLSHIVRKVKRFFFLATSRRVKHDFVFDPLALFSHEASPNLHQMARTSSSYPKRKKWDGAFSAPARRRGDADSKDSNSLGSYIFTTYIIVQFIIALGTGYGMLLYIEKMGPLRLVKSFHCASELLTMDGLLGFMNANQMLLSCLVVYFLSMFSVRNIGKLSDGGVAAVNNWTGEPGRLALNIGVLHLLLAGGVVSQAFAWTVSAGLVAQWLVLFAASKY